MKKLGGGKSKTKNEKSNSPELGTLEIDIKTQNQWTFAFKITNLET